MIRLRHFIFLALSFVGYISKGQSLNPTKKELLKLFKSSIRQDSKTKIITNSNPWVVCNDDSSYYKLDTIRLFPNSKKYPECICSCYIDWTFYKKDAFIMSSEYISEPRRVSAKNEWFKIKISQTEEGLLLSTFSNNNLIDRFKVVDINHYIVLKRLK